MNWWRYIHSRVLNLSRNKLKSSSFSYVGPRFTRRSRRFSIVRAIGFAAHPITRSSPGTRSTYRPRSSQSNRRRVSGGKSQSSFLRSSETRVKSSKVHSDICLSRSSFRRFAGCMVRSENPPFDNLRVRRISSVVTRSSRPLVVRRPPRIDVRSSRSLAGPNSSTQRQCRWGVSVRSMGRQILGRHGQELGLVINLNKSGHKEGVGETSGSD